MKNAWLISLLVLTSAGRAEAQGSPPIIPGNVAQYSTVNLPFCGPGAWNHEGLIAYDTGRHCAVWCDGSTWACLESDGGFVPIYSPDASTGLTVTGGDTMYLQAASATSQGAITIGTQTIPGTKTFANPVYADQFCSTDGGLCYTGNLATTGALNLFVDPTGNDANQCTASGVNACLTIQGAVNRVPKLIKHAVTITVASGNYAGAYLQGFTFGDPASAVTGEFIWLKGALITATVVTGAATGTATSSTAGSGGVAYSTLVDTAQTWTVNDLRGKWVEITAGTGVGQIFVIGSNTSTTLTIAGFWSTLPDVTSQYAIRDTGAVITSGVQSPAFPAISAGTPAALFIEAGQAPTGVLAFAPVVLERVGVVAPAGTNGLIIHGSGRFEADFVKVTGPSGFNNIEIREGAQAFLRKAIVSPVGGGVGVSISNQTQGRLRMDNSLIRGGGSSTGISLGPSTFVSVSTQLENNLTGIIFNGAASETQINNTFVDCENATGSTGIFMEFSFSRSVGIVLGGSSSRVTNCSVGVDLAGPSAIAILSFWGGTNNTTALLLKQGATANITSDTTMTGTTEISLDGDTFTLAQMRALNPAAITNSTYGTKVFQ